MPKKEEPTLEAFIASKERLLILDNLEKPGNIGGLFRTADGFGVDGVIYFGGQVDFYNPNTIRASLGCLFSIPI